MVNDIGLKVGESGRGWLGGNESSVKVVLDKDMWETSVQRCSNPFVIVND